jgi:hypothetical protein
MRRIRLLLISLFSLIGVIFGGVVLKKVLSISLCGLLGFNSIGCISFFSNDSRVNAALAPTKNESTAIVAPNTLKVPELIGDIPRIRKPELELPDDLQLVSQTPLNSGEREIQFISPSTGTEQIHIIAFPGTEKAEITSVEFKNTSKIDLRPIFVKNNIPDDLKVTSLIKDFKIFFHKNTPSKVILADKTSAEFIGQEIVIKSPNGKEIKRYNLVKSSFVTPDKLVISSDTRNKSIDYEKNIKPRENYGFLAQSNSFQKEFCNNKMRQTYKSIGEGLDDASEKLFSFDNPWAIGLGLGLGLASAILKDNVNSLSNPQDVICQPPVECNDQVASGGTGTYSQIFKIPRGTNQEVNIEYNFFEVPDTLEIFYNKEKKYSTNLVSGQEIIKNIRRKLSLPLKAEEVEIRMTGNEDIKTTKWEYKASCRQLKEPRKFPERVGTGEYYKARAADFEERAKEDFKSDPNLKPPEPDYYKNFGTKYYERLMQVGRETGGKLEKFTKNVGHELQNRMEKLVDDKPKQFAELERDAEAFKEFAYLSHISAYCNAGWGNLDVKDQLKILTSIDIKDSFGSLPAIYTGIESLPCTIKGKFETLSKEWGL